MNTKESSLSKHTSENSNPSGGLFNKFILAAFFFLGVLLTQWWYQKPKTTIESDSSVLIEKIEEVCKLVTIEAHLAARHDEENNKTRTWYLPLPINITSSKSASVEVEGKVLVGYDLQNIDIEADSINKIIILKNLPEPEILAIDHTLKYRDIEEDYFNTFSPKDFTDLNMRAKGVLKQRAIDTHLLEKAKEKGTEMLGVVEFMVKSAGWSIEFQQNLFEDVTAQREFMD